MRITTALLTILFLSGTAFAQMKPAIPSDAAARSRTPEQQAILDGSTAELQREMGLLGIKELRPPKNAVHPGRPDFANYNEAKANPYPDLPDPLVTKNGRKVTSSGMWWVVRRPEIVEDFDREVYGRVPKVTPKVKWEVTSTTPGKNGDVDIITKQLVGVVDNSIDPDIEVKIALTLVTPADAKGPVPVIMQFGGFGGFGGRRGRR